MHRFVQCSKILVDREYFACRKELAEARLLEKGPRVRFTSAKQWKDLCHESLDSLAHGLGHYIENNVVSTGDVNLGTNIPMVLPRLEEEVTNQLRICLIQMTQNERWATHRAKEVSLVLSASFAAFGGGIGLHPTVDHEHFKVQAILNYIMTFIICTLQSGKNGDDGIDSIPVLVCDCCKEDMPLCTPPAGVCRVIDLCDNCEIMHQGM